MTTNNQQTLLPRYTTLARLFGSARAIWGIFCRQILDFVSYDTAFRQGFVEELYQALFFLFVCLFFIFVRPHKKMLYDNLVPRVSSLFDNVQKLGQIASYASKGRLYVLICPRQVCFKCNTRIFRPGGSYSELVIKLTRENSLVRERCTKWCLFLHQ